MFGETVALPRKVTCVDTYAHRWEEAMCSLIAERRTRTLLRDKFLSPYQRIEVGLIDFFR